MLDSLPDEVFFEILSRLPLKAIIRSICVSRTWYSLISSPHFIVTHLNRRLSNPKHPPNRLLYHLDELLEKGYFTVHSSDVPFSSINFTKLRSVDLNIDELRIVVGSSNGLFCLADSFMGPTGCPYVLWNPSIQKAISLPDPDVEFRPSILYSTSLGFGYVPKTDDYKLVRLAFCYCDPHDTEYGIPHSVHIYTFRTHAWRSVRISGLPYFMEMRVSGTFFRGAVHWRAHIGHHNGERRHVIVSFDLEDEGFHELGMPGSLQEACRIDVAVLDGLIALVHGPYTWPESKAVWVMKEYGVVESWTKLFDIEAPGHKMLALIRVISFKETGEVLLEIDGNLFSYEPSNQRRVSLPFRDRGRSSFLDKYVESCPFECTRHKSAETYELSTQQKVSNLFQSTSLFLDKYVESLVLLNVPNTGMLKPT